MANRAATSNSLITDRAPETQIKVQLHPLVLLTISDYITRHTLREQEGEIVGAIIGQQDGRVFTLETAYECKMAEGENRKGGAVVDPEFFNTRLDQYKTVFSEPPLDLVGIFMLGPVEGPNESHLAAVKQIQILMSNESIFLVLFHPSLVNGLQGGKLPITIYEPVQEPESIDSQLKFRELSYEVETSEAERIAVEFVAKGGGNATMVPKADTDMLNDAAPGSDPSNKSKPPKGKGKEKVKSRDEDDTTDTTTQSTSVLTASDEELISSLTAKSNSIKMLQQRIELIKTYIAELPPSYLTDAQSTTAPAPDTNFALLRSIQAMISRLPLLAPPPESSPGKDSVASREKQDVNITELLASLTRAVAEAHVMGAKFGLVQRERQNRDRGSAFSSMKTGPLQFDNLL